MEMIKKIVVTFFMVCIATLSTASEKIQLLNVSYDSTREFYETYNKLFVTFWKEKYNQEVFIAQSHGGSSAQARAVIQGLNADIVTLASAVDIDLIAKKTHLISPKWQNSLPNNSCPYTSTIVFLVRKGNPKKITDWPDLLQKDITIIMPNPKTSGGARWNYLAAWGYAITNFGDEQRSILFMKQLFQHIPVLEPGARGASNAFAQRHIGDVLITWENEAYLILNKLNQDSYQIIWPSLSILAEPPVALVLGNTDKKGITPVARAYLQTLYSPDAQQLIAKFFYRPTNPEIAAQFSRFFPKIKMITIQDLGGWRSVVKKHFENGALFDQIYM
jgi:sulfate/thiosulfate transport system substrate-binding protein